MNEEFLDNFVSIWYGAGSLLHFVYLIIQIFGVIPWFWHWDLKKWIIWFALLIGTLIISFILSVSISAANKA